MAEEGIKLIEPCEELREAYTDYVNEFSEAEEGYIHGSGVELKGDFSEFVRLLQDYAKGINLPQGWVPASTYWLLIEGRVLGVSNLRHALTEFLRSEGGHIGYSIRPSERGKGYGELMLRLVQKRLKSWD